MTPLFYILVTRYALLMLTLPNLLTLSRIVTVPLLVALLWWPTWEVGYAAAFAVYCLMGITDYFDGYLARSQGAVSKLGVFLDPIADKIMVAAVILVLTAQGILRGPYVGDMHVIAGLIILLREIAVSGLREFLGGLQVSQDAVGRLREYRFPITVKVERPWWAPDRLNSRLNHVFDRVVYLSIAGQSLDWERGLSLDPRNFNDEHIQLLRRFRKLQRLNLSSTQISGESVDELVALRSLKVLDISHTRVGDAGISEFKKRRPDCLVCNSQPGIFAHLQSDRTIRIGDKRGRLEDSANFLADARRGPDAFGYVPMLYIFADERLVRRRAQMIREVRQAAIDAGYQKIQIEGR